ncbi:ubiquitin-like domain-containing protein [Rhodotorula paludigena]|uniref:ubiquitin-like domain-containing protein n=1 Tax=Rhodotorula paludigena TaxID=86838 RepID=UPI00316DBC98
MPSIPDSLYLRHGDVTYLLQRPLNHSELCAQARRLFSIEPETVIHLERLVDEIGAVRITDESWALDTAQTRLSASPALYVLVVEESESAEEGDDDDETLSDLGALNWDDCRASLLSGIMTPSAPVAPSVQETVAAEDEEEPAPRALQRTDVPTSSIVDFGRCFTLNARLSSGRDIAIPVHPLCRIHELKAHIAAREDLSLGEQNLVWAGSVLEDDRTAASYGLPRSSILHVVQRTSESEYW